MKKIVLILLSILLLSGCNGTYTLNINKDYSYDEKLIIENFNEFTVYNEFESYMNSNYPSNEVSFERINLNGESYSLSATRNEKNISELENEKLVLDNFGTFKIDKEKRRISFIPDMEKCMGMLYNGDEEIESETKSILRVNVNIPFKVLKNNANIIENNIYTWELSMDSCAEEMYIQYQKVETFDYVVIIGAFLLVTLTIIVLVNKSKKVNRI